MDFTDVARLMGRRWYLTVPLLLLTVVAMAWTVVTVEPDYKATAHVTLVPATVQEPIELAKTTVTINPWEPATLADAASILLQSKSLADSLAEQGYQGEWTVTPGESALAVLTIEVVSPTEEQAVTTVNKLIDTVEADVVAQQAPLKLAKGKQITTTTLGEPDTAAVNSKLTRALVVVFGVGLILTVAVAVAVDAMLRRRARLRAAMAQRAGVGSPESLTTPGLDTAMTTRFMTGGPSKSKPGKGNLPAQAGPAQANQRSTNKSGSGAVYGQSRNSEPAATPRTSTEYRANTVSKPDKPADAKPDKAPSKAPGRAETAPSANRAIPTPGTNSDGKRSAQPAEPPAQQVEQEDATIVLPLSNTTWGSKASEAKRP